jgi:hypothetical protein
MVKGLKIIFVRNLYAGTCYVIGIRGHWIGPTFYFDRTTSRSRREYVIFDC